MPVVSKYVVLAVLFSGLVACSADDETGTAGGSCGELAGGVPAVPSSGYTLSVSGDADGSDSSSSEVGWFDLNGAVALSFGSEVGSGAALQFTGLTRSSGKQCATSAQLFLDSGEWRNGTETAEGWAAGGTPFTVDLTVTEELVSGQFSGVLQEAADGSASEVSVVGAFAVEPGGSLLD